MIICITQSQYQRALSLCECFEEDDSRYDGNNENAQMIISKAITSLIKCHARKTYPRLRKKIKRPKGEKYQELFLKLNKAQIKFIDDLSCNIKQSMPNTLRIVLEWYLYDQLVFKPRKNNVIYGTTRNSPEWDDSF